MKQKKPNISVFIEDPSFDSVIKEDDVLRISSFFLDRFSCKSNVSIILVNDHDMQNLNFTYRQKNCPTNVLSFPMEDDHYLGDIFLSFGVIKRESLEQNKTFENHFTHLLIHGLLHLLGYDHINPEDQNKMENLEIKFLQELCIPNPYI